MANAAYASRKDARDAVIAARKAFGGWSTRTPYNRGQVLYRVAEVLEGRRGQFVEEVGLSEGLSTSKAEAVVDASVDRLVWYAGWADKIAQVVGGANPVAGPYFNFSMPDPTGVIAVLAPQQSSLLGLVSVVAPVIVTGNTCVVTSSYERPIPAVTLSEVLATSDVPGGVVNILTGQVGDTAPWLASHMDVNGIDLTGAAGDLEHARELEVAAAENLKRVVAHRPPSHGLDRGPGHRPDDGVPRDQDRLAPDRDLTRWSVGETGGHALTRRLVSSSTTRLSYGGLHLLLPPPVLRDEADDRL